MKFLHVADLHIGKIVNDFSMLEDQKFILKQITEIAFSEHVEGVLIAGDIYDRAIPPAEAVAVFDRFVTELSENGVRVFIVSGNHDSPERISFGEEIFDKAGVHIAGALKEELKVIKIPQDYGELQVVLLPFVKPAQADVKTTQEAVEKLLSGYWEQEEKAADKVRRILVTHYFVTDAGKEPELSDSETTVHVGGLDNVDASLFQGFDYVALGHIHKPQKIGAHQVWYGGSPLKYSFGESGQVKRVLLFDIDEAGTGKVEEAELSPLREMRKITGSLAELMENTEYRDAYREDYIQAVLTDKGELIDPIGTLRSAYPNIMQIVRQEALQNSETAGMETAGRRRMAEKKDTFSLFTSFYREVRGEELGEEGKQVIRELIKELEE